MSLPGDRVFFATALTVLWARDDAPWWLFIGLLGLGILVNYLHFRRESKT